MWLVDAEQRISQQSHWWSQPGTSTPPLAAEGWEGRAGREPARCRIGCLVNFLSIAHGECTNMSGIFFIGGTALEEAPVCQACSCSGGH
mmetsp:Transcript_11313/g.26028  ORF Transcript_11313/g.26028 Transcript_11313/m.26028 type:complete len:89 (+) Transcript_11313:186-452(+)